MRRPAMVSALIRRISAGGAARGAQRTVQPNTP
jgi:hypothetical protein